MTVFIAQDENRHSCLLELGSIPFLLDGRAQLTHLTKQSLSAHKSGLLLRIISWKNSHDDYHA